MFIDQDYIENLLESSKKVSDAVISAALDKAERMQGLSHAEVAALLTTENPEHISRIFKIAGEIKEHIYGNRIVMFAPLYVSDYCVNKCSYCSYKRLWIKREECRVFLTLRLLHCLQLRIRNISAVFLKLQEK